jgi:hypothetical protein
MPKQHRRILACNAKRLSQLRCACARLLTVDSDVVCYVTQSNIPRCGSAERLLIYMYFSLTSVKEPKLHKNEQANS